MAIVMIGDWGKDAEGVHTMSVNTTTKQEILQIIETITEEGAKFWQQPDITFKARTYHALLQFYVPKEMGYPEESE